MDRIKVKTIRTWATVKNGKINWIAQIGSARHLSTRMKEFTKTFSEDLIRVEVKQVSNG